MPAIRDFSIGFSGATATTNITVPLPAYNSGDLLIAFINQDTGTKTTTVMTGSITGGTWTLLLDDTNTNQGNILYCNNYTGSATETTFTRTGGTTETFDVIIVSVYDYNTTTPFNATPAAFTTQAAAAKITFPSITTTINNCLLFHYWALSGNPSTTVGTSPLINEGPATFITGIEGGSTSTNPGGQTSALAWGFKATAGATGTLVGASCMTTSVGLKVTIAVAPPAGGATVIPTYCSADSSLFLDPIGGNNAYNGNTAYAATATTYFPSPLAAPNSRPVANGTVANLADQGLSSWHSIGQLTGGTTNGTWSGGTLVFATANKPNLDGKNLLLHVAPATPKSLQTTDSITKGTTKGVAIGLFSAASNYKVWHVHGVGTAWKDARHVPVVVNSSNTTGLISTTGSLNATSVLGIGTFISGFVAAPVWAFYSAWMLDTTTVVGGNAANPIDISGLTLAVSDGHIRKSVLQQGKSQATILQPIQLGNGGTDPLYVNFDSTAIEFPQNYNLSGKQVFYCSIDDYAGFTLYPGASDTVVWTNAIVSSASKYHFKLHASASTSATYNFDGLSLIGAGTVTLNKAISISGMSISGYGTLDLSNATFTAGNITKPPATSAQITTNASTSISNTNINVTTVTGGNWWWAGTKPDTFSNCNFTGSASSGHALKFTQSGTYNFVGNKFTGFGATDTTNAAILVDAVSVTLQVSSGGDNSITYRAINGGSLNVQQAVNLTLTGLVVGSDIVILDAGTTTERVNINANGATTYVFSFTTGGSVDICVYKQGYIPRIERNYTLPTQDGSLPMKQTVDRNFSNPAN